MDTLLQTGFGKRIDLNFQSSASNLDYRKLLKDYRFLVLKKAAQNLDGAVEIMSSIGQLVNHEKRKDGVLELDGSKEEKEVLRGKEFMPLHKDGLLMGLEVNVVGIFCLELENVSGGRTYISDMKSAISKLSKDHIEVLSKYGIEGQAVDTDYYLKEGGIWHKMPAIKELEDGLVLSMGFPYPENSMASWNVRIAEVETEVSDEILEGVESVLMRDPFIYYHEWDEGDMLLMDNQRVLHGRESFTGHRTLSNLQIIYA